MRHKADFKYDFMRPERSDASDFAKRVFHRAVPDYKESDDGQTKYQKYFPASFIARPIALFGGGSEEWVDLWEDALGAATLQSYLLDENDEDGGIVKTYIMYGEQDVTDKVQGGYMTFRKLSMMALPCYGRTMHFPEDQQPFAYLMAVKEVNVTFIEKWVKYDLRNALRLHAAGTPIDRIETALQYGIDSDLIQSL